MPAIYRWFAGDSCFMGKLVLEESVIIQVLGWGLECRRLLFNRVCLRNGHDHQVECMWLVQGNSGVISRVDLYQTLWGILMPKRRFHSSKEPSNACYFKMWIVA